MGVILSPLDQYCQEVRAHFSSSNFAPNIVYTVMIGRSDQLKQPRVVDQNCSYYCVTDRTDLKFGVWQPVILPVKHRDDRRTARVIKLRPELVFGQLETSVFVDASILIQDSLANLWTAYAPGRSVAAFRHGERECSYEEARACISQAKAEPESIRTQMRRYRSEGFPQEAGLIASGVLLRNHQDPEVNTLMTYWLNEIEVHTARDQLSFSYAAWKTGVSYAAIPLDIFKNSYVEVSAHSRLSRFDDIGRNVVSSAEQLRHRILALRAMVIHRIRRYRRR